MTSITLHPRRARPFFARHPWVLAPSIARIDGPADVGTEVRVLNNEGTFIARGLYNPLSAIRVRLYRWEDTDLDHAFWESRIQAAIRLRTDVLGLGDPEGACRLIFSEADGLSGLTVDRYGRWLVAQFTSHALFDRRETILRLLKEHSGAEGIWLRTERGMAKLEGLDLEPQQEPVIGTWPDAAITIVENGLRYQVDPRSGQKTGFYLDQRENRQAAARLAAGRRVLDLFCYSGGFGLTALKHGGATHVLGIDSSEPAIELARRNAVENQLGHARFEAADVAATLKRLHESTERFGMVILDPPKFARNAQALPDAIRGYVGLNRSAIDVLEPGGILVTCSCSGHVSRQVFAEALNRVAEHSSRTIQILELRGQAPDHPVSSSCLENDYLKCVIARVS